MAVAAAIGTVVAFAAFPSGADLSEELEELKAKQEQVQADQTNKAVEIDAATAEVGDLTLALQTITGQVNEQATKVATAEQALIAAEARHLEATTAVEAQTEAIVVLEDRMQERAISTFVNQDNSPTPILEETDPNQAIRMQTLVDTLSGDDADVGEELQTAREDLQIEQETAAAAQTEAATIRTQLAADLVTLEESRIQQQTLVDESELRLEAQLAEAAALTEMDQQLAAEITQKNEELAAQAAAARRQAGASGSGGGALPALPASGEIVSVRGIWVHQSISGNVEGMLAAAEADGVPLTGGGYRDPQAQIRLRRAHCGTSDYAIYEMPSSQCSPPTARPGRSNHERGLAIDFQYNGASITSRSSPAYVWLAAHAAEYGFYNLPSEPWHWSVDGN